MRWPCSGDCVCALRDAGRPKVLKFYKKVIPDDLNAIYETTKGEVDGAVANMTTAKDTSARSMAFRGVALHLAFCRTCRRHRSLAVCPS